MKGFNKFLSIIFAIIIVFLAVCLILFVGGIIKAENITNVLDMLMTNRQTKLTTVIISAVVGLIAIIFAITVDGEGANYGGSLTLPLTTGNISITGQTFEAIVLNIARKYNSLKNVKAKVDIKEDGLYIDLYTYVLAGTIVSEVMCKVQEDIKNTILKQTTVEVKMVEVKVKGIYNQSEDKLQD